MTPDSHSQERDEQTEMHVTNEVLEWRPIETAPKDGTLVLLYSSGVGVGKYITSKPDDELQLRPGGWVFWPAGLKVSGIVEPRHWMPLPAPPSESRSSSERGKPGDPVLK